MSHACTLVTKTDKKCDRAGPADEQTDRTYMLYNYGAALPFSNLNKLVPWRPA